MGIYTNQTKGDKMRIFNLDDRFNIVCDTQNTRNGFKHIAILHSYGFEVSRTKVCYINRTWERFQYETVLEHLINQFFDEPEKSKFLKIIASLH